MMFLILSKFFSITISCCYRRTLELCRIIKFKRHGTSTSSPGAQHIGFMKKVGHSFDCIIGRAKRAPHWGVQSRFRVIYVGMYVCRGPKSVGGITWAKRAHAQSQYWAVKSDQY